MQSAALTRFSDRASLYAAFVEKLTVVVRTALEMRGRAVLALSGGTTPLPVYAAFAALDLEWRRIGFALVDERWVETADQRSNEGRLREALAPAIAAGAVFTGMKNAAASAGAGLANCEARYRSLSLPFDELVLGMGEDGHIASLFPNAQGLAEALDMRNRSLCAAVMAPPGGVAGAVLDRMSLTLHGLLSARRIDLLVTGDRKLQLLLEDAPSDGGTADLPVCHILGQRTVPVRVWWAP